MVEPSMLEVDSKLSLTPLQMEDLEIAQSWMVSSTPFRMVVTITSRALISIPTSKPKPSPTKHTETTENGPEWPSRASPSLASSAVTERSLSTAATSGTSSPFQFQFLPSTQLLEREVSPTSLMLPSEQEQYHSNLEKYAKYIAAICQRFIYKQVFLYKFKNSYL